MTTALSTLTLFVSQKFQAISAAYTKLVSSDSEEEDDDIPNVSPYIVRGPPLPPKLRGWTAFGPPPCMHVISDTFP